jgi:hypothetical protein
MKAYKLNWRRLLIVLFLASVTVTLGGCASTGYSVGLNYGYGGYGYPHRSYGYPYGYPYRPFGYSYRPFGYSFGYHNRYHYPYWYSTPYWRSRPYWGPYRGFYGPRFGLHFYGHRKFRH